MSALEERRNKLYSIASQQQGYFSAKQALACGYSHRMQHYHKEKAHWEEIERGFFRLTNFPASDHEDFVRWSFWSRNREDKPQGVISHESALAFYELSDVMPAKVHLSVPLHFRKKPPGGCVLHKRILALSSIVPQEGFSVTSLLQTIIDVAEGTLASDQLEQALRDGFATGNLTPAHIINARMSIKAKEKMRIILDTIKKNPNSMNNKQTPRIYDTPQAFKAALSDRLRNKSLQTNIPIDRLRKELAFERFLARLFEQPHTENPYWLLKGGYALGLRFSAIARPTKDIDVAIPHMADPTPESIQTMLQKAAEKDLGDFLVYHIGRFIQELSLPIYGGWRYPAEVRLSGKIFTKFHVDVAVGDAVISKPEWVRGSEFLSFAGINAVEVPIFPKEQHFAEKIHTYTMPRDESQMSRVKDLVDLILLIEQKLPEKTIICKAITATFERRKTHAIPKTLIAPPARWEQAYSELAQDCGVSIKNVQEAFQLLTAYWNDLSLGKEQ